jgi:hypothetical protein
MGCYIRSGGVSGGGDGGAGGSCDGSGSARDFLSDDDVAGWRAPSDRGQGPFVGLRVNQPGADSDRVGSYADEQSGDPSQVGNRQLRIATSPPAKAKESVVWPT